MIPPDDLTGEGTTAPSERERDVFSELAAIVASGQAAAAVLIDEIATDGSGSVEVRPVVSQSVEAWLEGLVEGLGEIRGRVVALTSDNAELAARLAVSLAAWLAEHGTVVTLVDGFIEEPVLAKGLPDDGEEGLVDAVLFGVSSSTIARRTLVAGVRLVTAGSYPISVPAVLGAEAYITTLQKLAREDATVLLVLPTSYASAAAVAAGQLVVVGTDIGGLDALTRELRAAESLRALRIVAVLSGSLTGLTTAEAAVPSSVEAVPDVVPDVEPEPVRPSGVEIPEADHPVTEAEPAFVTTARRGGIPPDDAGTREAVVTAELHEGDGVERADDGFERGRRGRMGRATAVISVFVLAVLVGVALRTGLFERWRSASEHDEPAIVSRIDDPEESAREQDPVFDVAVAPELTASAAQDQHGDGTETNERTTETEDTGISVVEPMAVAEGRNGAAVAPRAWREISITPAQPGHYVVFTSSHKHERAAERDAAALRGKSFPGAVVCVEVPGRGIWYRVDVDAGFAVLDDTRELLDTMREVGYEGAWVERLRKPVPPD
ncbi:hypothetical protein K8S17_06650, partial [bacterium]|nr:hypothetical protein [bacterium]